MLFHQYCAQRRTANPANRARHSLQFENLEDRRVLATGVLSGGILSVDLANDDIQLVVGNDGQNITFGTKGQIDLNPDLPGTQTVALADVHDIVVSGTVTGSGQPQSLILNNQFHINGLEITGLNHVLFDGDFHLNGDLQIDLADNPFTGKTWLATIVDNSLIVEGATLIDVSNGDMSLEHGIVQLNGPVSLANDAAEGRLEIHNDAPINLQDVNVTSELRLVAPEITDSSDSVIFVSGKTFLRSDSILLGETSTDSVDFHRVNFKSQGIVEISDDNLIELMGRNFAQSTSIVADSRIGDGGNASTIISDHASFTARHIVLGDRPTDEFMTGTISFTSDGHIEIADDGNITLAEKNIARSVNLYGANGISNQNETLIQVQHQFGLQADGDIDIGNQTSDFFDSGTISFAAPGGHVSLNSDTHLHIIDSKNIAESLNLISNGQITDDAFASLYVDDTANFQSKLLTLGDGDDSRFHAGKVNFQVTNFVSLSQDNDIILTGNNHATQLELKTSGEIIDDNNTQLNIRSSTSLEASRVVLGEHVSNEVNTGWVTFDSTGDVEINEDSDIVLGWQSTAMNLRLNANGWIHNRSSLGLRVVEHANLEAVNIAISDTSDFISNSLTVNSQGSATVYSTGNIMLSGESRVDTLRLRSSGAIENMPNATIRSNFLMDLEGESVNLGGYENDMVASSTLRFETQNETRIRLNRSILIVDNSSAMSAEIASTGDILDVYDATVQVENFVRLEGVDVILGDSEADCFSVTDGVVDVTASGREEVILDQCG